MPKYRLVDIKPSEPLSLCDAKMYENSISIGDYVAHGQDGYEVINIIHDTEDSTLHLKRCGTVMDAATRRFKINS